MHVTRTPGPGRSASFSQVGFFLRATLSRHRSKCAEKKSKILLLLFFLHFHLTSSTDRVAWCNALRRKHASCSPKHPICPLVPPKAATPSGAFTAVLLVMAGRGMELGGAILAHICACTLSLQINMNTTITATWMALIATGIVQLTCNPYSILTNHLSLALPPLLLLLLLLLLHLWRASASRIRSNLICFPSVAQTQDPKGAILTRHYSPSTVIVAPTSARWLILTV